MKSIDRPTGKGRRHLAWLYSQLPHWQARGWLAEGAADAIREEYGAPIPPRGNLLVVLIAILGTGFIAAGISLLIGHNWDELSRPARAAIAIMLPLLAHGAGIFALKRHPDSRAWREACSLSAILALPVAMALISQTYNIQGTLENLLLATMLFGLPVLYLYQGIASLLAYLYVAVWWGYINPAWDNGTAWPLLLLLAAPAGMARAQFMAGGLRRTWTAFAYLAAITIGLPACIEEPGIFAIVLYAAWFGNAFAIGSTYAGLRHYTAFGAIGTGLILIIGAYEEFWDFMLGYRHLHTSSFLTDFYVLGLALLIPPTYLAVASFRRRAWLRGAWLCVPLLMAGMLLLGLYGYSTTPALTMSFTALAFGITAIIAGAKASHATLVNAGMLLTVCTAMQRFFDANFGMVERGVVFILIGAGFLAVNLMLRRKKIQRTETPNPGKEDAP